MPGLTPTQTLVVDNGAYTIKAGFADGQCKLIPNCLARDRARKVYVGSQVAECKDFGDITFRRPVDKGYLVNWESEKEIWEREFFDEQASLKCDPQETALLLTEAPNALPALQTNCDQVVFEEFQFASYYRRIGPVLNCYNDKQAIFKVPSDEGLQPAEILMVIDSGYSHTTVTPLLQGRPIHAACRRLDVGGKLLTNYLTRLLSLRQFDMRNETYLVNDIKESACYISRDFEGDIERCWKGTLGERRNTGGIAVDYVLPDYHKIEKGYIRTHAQTTDEVMTLRNERFVVPELLFNPMDIGLRQPGLAQIVMESLSKIPEALWPGFLSNIFVVGGNANIEGFIQKLYGDIRELAPAECVVRVAKPPEPILSTWQGGANLAREGLQGLSVTKQEYEEHGSAWTAKQFK